MKKVIIIGGGVAGLGAAFKIKRAADAGADVDFVLLEKDNRLGGKVLGEIVETAQRGYVDFGFVGGAQIDPYGNLNSTVIGDHDHPKARLPGSGGANDVGSHCWRTIAIMRHDKKRFVEKVDFITAAGVTPQSVHREGGPTLMVTPKAILSWDREAGEWVLTAVHPGSSMEDVKENTGFPLRTEDSLIFTPAPTERELMVLRTAVREKLGRIYPDFAEKKIRKFV